MARTKRYACIRVFYLLFMLQQLLQFICGTRGILLQQGQRDMHGFMFFISFHASAAPPVHLRHKRCFTAARTKEHAWMHVFHLLSCFSSSSSSSTEQEVFDCSKHKGTCMHSSCPCPRHVSAAPPVHLRHKRCFTAASTKGHACIQVVHFHFMLQQLLQFICGTRGFVSWQGQRDMHRFKLSNSFSRFSSSSTSSATKESFCHGKDEGTCMHSSRSFPLHPSAAPPVCVQHTYLVSTEHTKRGQRDGYVHACMHACSHPALINM